MHNSGNSDMINSICNILQDNTICLSQFCPLLTHHIQSCNFLDGPLICIFYRYIRGSLNKFPDVWAFLLIVHIWNSSPLRSNLLWLQCTCCTVPTISARPHGSPLVGVCQWPSSQPLSSPQLSHNDSLWA